MRRMYENMYVHLGEDTLIEGSQLIAIINLPDKKAYPEAIDKIIKNAKKKKKLEVINHQEKAKALIICQDKVYISGISSHTLYKRAEQPYREEKIK